MQKNLSENIMKFVLFNFIVNLLSLLILSAAQLVLPELSEVTIESHTQNVTVVKGNAVVLRCTVHNMGAHQQIIWRKGYEVIAAGPVLLKIDLRYSVDVAPGSSQLKISSTSLEDGGEYVCQVQTGQGLKEAKHSVIVQVPPSILPVPTEGLVTAKQGESVSLRCNATGVPLPTIAWHKSVGTPPGAHSSCEGTCYTIPYVDLRAGGDYICSAVNGVGQPSHATITLHVLCK